MNIPAPLAILVSAIILASAIYFRPAPAASHAQAFYGNGYVYFVDLDKREVTNMIPVKQ